MVFRADGTQGVGILGNCQRENGEKWGRIFFHLFPQFLHSLHSFSHLPPSLPISFPHFPPFPLISPHFPSFFVFSPFSLGKLSGTSLPAVSGISGPCKCFDSPFRETDQKQKQWHPRLTLSSRGNKGTCGLMGPHPITSKVSIPWSSCVPSGLDLFTTTRFLVLNLKVF